MNDTYYHTSKEQFNTELTAVEYAAIHLCQPISGTPWLDEAITKARRERLAGQTLAGFLGNYFDHKYSVRECAYEAIDAADALIAALEGGAK